MTHPEEEALIEVAMGESTSDSAKAHVAGCAACQQRVASMRDVLADGARALDTLTAPAPLTRAEHASTLRAIEQHTKANRGWDVPVAIFLLAAVFIARRATHASPREVALALVIAAAAMLLARLAQRRPLEAAIAGLVTAFGVAALDAAQGVRPTFAESSCLVFEGGFAALATAWTLWRGSPDPYTVAATATAAALGAQAALVVTCHAPHSLEHSLLFHSVGVLLSSIVAGAAAQAHRLRSQRSS